MRDAYIAVRRIPYEEPYHTQLEIEVSNGCPVSGCFMVAKTDIYCHVSDIEGIGRALQSFPQDSGEYTYEYGSSNTAVKWYRHFSMRVYRVATGIRCAVQITIDQKEDEPDDARCCFSIRSDIQSVNRLGDLFLELSQLRDPEFKWVVNSHFND